MGLAPLLLTLLLAKQRPPGRPQLLVAAAASVRPALEEIAREFERRQGCRVVVSYGASGILEKQIENGAPFDVFFSADEERVDHLAGRHLTDVASRTIYAVGRLALAASRNADPAVKSLADLPRSRFRRLALPNPDTAPYGAAAKETLQKLRLWDGVRDRVVVAENVRDALRYAETGDADFAFSALSEARESGLRLVEVPPGSHHRLFQAACALRTSAQPELARRLLALAAGSEGRRIWVSHGFEEP
jgi:molybdate transport system substrate-binding protein